MRIFLTEMRKAVRLFRPIYWATAPFLKVVSKDDLVEPGPETFVGELVANLHTAMDQVDSGQLEAVLRSLLVAMTKPEVRKWVRSGVERELRADRQKIDAEPRRVACMQYIDDLERRLPGAAVLIFAMDWLAPRPQRRLAEWVDTYYVAQRYDLAKGEKRARLLRDGVRSALVHHERCIRTLNTVERLAAGRPVSNELSYGVMAGDLGRWLPASLQPLVCRDAVHWRNAAAHPDGWTNSPDFQSVQLRDVGRRGQVWTQTITCDELHAGLGRTLDWIAALQDAVRVKLSSEMFAVVRSARLLDMLLHATGVESTGVTREMFDEHLKRYFEPLERSFARSAAAAVAEPPAVRPN